MRDSKGVFKVGYGFALGKNENIDKRKWGFHMLLVGMLTGAASLDNE